MLLDYKLSQTSVVLRVKIRNSSVATGAGLTGLTSASSGLRIGTIADNEAATTVYTAGGSTIETITTLGTFATPTATKCRFKEVDATSHPGIYELQLDNTRYAVSSSKSLLISITGATNAADADVLIPLRSVDPYDAVRFGLTALPNTAVTTNASLLTSGTGTDQVSVSAGKVLLQSTQTGVTIPTVTTVTNQLTAAAVATGVWQDATSGDFTVSSSIGKSLYTSGAAPGAANGLFIAGTNAATTVTTAFTSTFTGNLTGSVGSVTGSVGSVTGAVGSVTGAVGSVTGAVGSVASGGIAAASFASGAITAAAIADGAIDRATFAVDTGLLTIRSGTAQAGAAGTITLDASASSTTDAYLDRAIYLTGGTGSGQTRRCTAYNGTTKVATITPNWTTTPDSSSTFAVLPAPLVDIGLVSGSAASTVSGALDSNLISVNGTTFSGANVPADLQTIKTQTVTAAAGVTFPASVASPTNITAGTITTATNLTNAPTSGDFTATMKTSLNASTPASVTGAVGSVASGGITSASFAAGAITASVIADAAIDRATFAADTGLLTIRSGTAQSGGGTSITLDSGASATTDYYKNALIFITGGTGSGQGRFITAYNGSTKVATVGAWATNPDVTSTFAITAFDSIPGATAPSAAAVATAVWTDLLAGSDFSTASSVGKLLKDDVDATVSSRLAPTVSGRTLDVSATGEAGLDWANVGSPTTSLNLSGTTVGTVTTTTTATNVTTVNGLAANVITAASIASDADTELASAVWDLATSGHTTSGTFGAAMGAAGAAGDPWSTSLPGSYGSGTAGNIVGNRIDATITSRLAPTVASRTLDVSATGEAGVDWANVGSPTTSLNLSGTTISTGQAVASVAGAVGSVTGSVGSVTGNVGGNVVGSTASVTGSVGSVTGAVGSVTGNVGGNVVGSVASVTGAVGSVTGSVGSVVGAVGSVAGAVTTTSNIKKNQSLNAFPFVMTDDVNHVPTAGFTVAATRSLEGGAFASCANAPSAIGNGAYKITLNSTDTNANTIVFRFTATGADTRMITVITQP